MVGSKRRVLNAAHQLLALRAVTPTTGTARRGVLDCRIEIQPTPASRVYTVRIRQQSGEHPHVTVVDPPLDLHEGEPKLPHVYPGDELCLYYPSQWRSDLLLAVTVLPWTAEWLLHYEIWLATGKWTGGGH